MSKGAAMLVAPVGSPKPLPVCSPDVRSRVKDPPRMVPPELDSPLVPQELFRVALFNVHF